MDDFDTFIDHLKKGDADEVRKSFRQDFLERPDEHKNRPIHLACKNGHVDIAKFLIEHGCDIECVNNQVSNNYRGQRYVTAYQKYRPIHLACKNGHVEIVKLLVRNGCELQSKTEDGQTPLLLAQQSRSQACAVVLTEALKLSQVFDFVRKNECQNFEELKTADVLIKEEKDTGLSFLEVVLEANAAEVLKYFLDKTLEDEEIPPIRFYIENCSRPAAVELMQEFFLYRSIRDHHADGFELSFLANIVNGHHSITTTSFVETAAEFGTSAFITEILKKSIYNKDEWTRAKDLAKQKGYNKIVDAISDREILLTQREKAHFSSFHNAICDNDFDLMRYIFDNGLADPDFNNEVVGTGMSLAHMLCHVKCIETLQQFNVDVNTQNKYFQSPLHEAISSGMTDHCSYLIRRARDIDKPGFMGLSGLQCALMEGLENLCDEFVKNRADCMRYVEGLQQSHFKDTALPISTRENAVTLCIKIHQTIYPCFLDILDAKKVNCSDGNGNTLLHHAVKALLPDLCQTLINGGANVQSINGLGNTIFFELFNHSEDKLKNENINEIIKISNILIASGEDINRGSCSGVSLFESASKCNSERIMIHLLSKHPDLTILSESDFKLAFTNAWFSYANDLIEQMPEDSLKLFISTEVFHVAIRHAGAKLLISLFLKASSDVQQSIIEDLLLHFAVNDECDAFTKLLQTKVIEPKLFPNGETLFTSILKDKNVKYCLSILGMAAYRNCFNLANISNQIPLQVAIELELYDLIWPLIFKCDQINNEDNDGNTPLNQIFQKLSNSTDINTNTILMTAVESIILRGGDIHIKTSAGIKNIEFCSRLELSTEIQDIQNRERNEELAPSHICKICLERELDCAFDCGHTACMTCGLKIVRCPMCNAEPTNPRKIYIN